ncbi:hypothetical protein NDU88_002226 [Pleurodeles waltl]|uniref:Uncharacterized protein n=1 Tax=Pleurodeles waltl TaxID=8319 RepID=A0AAV7P9D1_PLEWA|nr:hypothetical protein NDU88_002226 [Pleurodeles waltl]
MVNVKLKTVPLDTFLEKKSRDGFRSGAGVVSSSVIEEWGELMIEVDVVESRAEKGVESLDSKALSGTPLLASDCSTLSLVGHFIETLNIGHSKGDVPPIRNEGLEQQLPDKNGEGGQIMVQETLNNLRQANGEELTLMAACDKSRARVINSSLYQISLAGQAMRDRTQRQGRSLQNWVLSYPPLARNESKQRRTKLLQ